MSKPISVTVTSSSGRLAKTDVSHLKSGGRSKRVTRSQTKDDAADEEDDCLVIATHPPGTVAPQLPMDKVPQSLPAVTTAADSNPAPRASRSRRVREESEKSEKSKKIKKDVKSEKVDKSTSKSSKSKSGVSVVSASRTMATNTPSVARATSSSAGAGTQTVSVTATQVTSTVQKQFGDTSKKRRLSDAQVLAPAAKFSKPSADSSLRSAFAPVSTGAGPSSSSSAANLMSSIKPVTSSSLMPSRPSRAEVVNTDQDGKVICNAGSGSQSVVPPSSSSSSTRRDQTGYVGFVQHKDAAGPSSRRTPERRSSPAHSPSADRRRGSLERGRVSSRSDYRSNSRSVSIPVRRTYTLVPSSATELQSFDYGLQSPVQHTG